MPQFTANIAMRSRLAGRYAAPEQITFAEGHRFPHDRAANQALAESIRRGLFS